MRTDGVDHDTVTYRHCPGCGQPRVFYVRWFTGYSRLYCSAQPWRHVLGSTTI